MIKGIDRNAEITEVTLLEKSGGRSGVWRRGDDPYRP
jgi:cyclic pyranopterin phosphate synthase